MELQSITNVFPEIELNCIDKSLSTRNNFHLFIIEFNNSSVLLATELINGEMRIGASIKRPKGFKSDELTDKKTWKQALQQFFEKPVFVRLDRTNKMRKMLEKGELRQLIKHILFKYVFTKRQLEFVKSLVINNKHEFNALSDSLYFFHFHEHTKDSANYQIITVAVLFGGFGTCELSYGKSVWTTDDMRVTLGTLFANFSKSLNKMKRSQKLKPYNHKLFNRIARGRLKKRPVTIQLTDDVFYTPFDLRSLIHTEVTNGKHVRV